MCPRTQGNCATLKGWPLVTSIAVALECDPLISSTENKLPWIMPVAINRSEVIANPFCLFYPTGHSKTSAVKVDYRGSGKKI